MQIAKIVGNIVATHSHKSVEGHALFLCQPIDERGEEIGDVIIAINSFGGGMGSRVLVSSDGGATRGYVGDARSPLRNSVICVLD